MSLESNKGGAHSPPSSPLKLDYWLSSTLYSSFKKFFLKKTINIHCTRMLPTSGSRYDGIKSQKSTWSFLVTGVDKKQSNNKQCSYDLEMKTHQQIRNNKRTEIERIDWFIERTQTRVAFGWLSERSGEKTSCPRTLQKSIDTLL